MTRNEKVVMVIITTLVIVALGLLTISQCRVVQQEPQLGDVRWEGEQLQAYQEYKKYGDESAEHWWCIDKKLLIDVNKQIRRVDKRITRKHCSHSMKFIEREKKGYRYRYSDMWKPGYTFRCKKCNLKVIKYESNIDPNTSAAIKELGL